MPMFGLLALFRFIRRTGGAVWGREESRGLATATIVVIAIGAVVFRQAEPEQFKSWTDAIYFTVITLTTVGFGDFSPTTTLTTWFAIL